MLVVFSLSKEFVFVPSSYNVLKNNSGVIEVPGVTSKPVSDPVTVDGGVKKCGLSDSILTVKSPPSAGT